MFRDTTTKDKELIKEISTLPKMRKDDLQAILGIAKNIQRKAQAMGSLGKRRWLRESSSYRYLSIEVDHIYQACTRVLKEFGK